MDNLFEAFYKAPHNLAYEEGYKAYADFVFECPYTEGTEAWMSWIDGWLDARFESPE